MSKRLVIRQGRVHAIYAENDERGWPQEPFEVVSTGRCYTTQRSLIATEVGR